MTVTHLLSRRAVHPVTPAEVSRSDDSDWRALYLTALAAAVSMLATIPLALVAYIVWPPPFDEPASEWFALFQESWLRGLLGLDLLFLASNVLMIPIYLALFVALRRVSQTLMAMALALGGVGLAAYFSSNTAFQMLLLSDRYQSAGTEAERIAVRGAGEAMLATFEGTAFNVYYVLSAIALLLIATVMLRSTVFNRCTAYVGLITGAFTIVPATAGMLGVIFSLLSLIPWMVFLALIGWRFYKLGVTHSHVAARQLPPRRLIDD